MSLGNPYAPAVPQIEPEELKRRLDAGEDVLVLDVREPFEYQFCNLGGQLIPLGQLLERIEELDRHRPIVVHCHLGYRSAEAVQMLEGAGFHHVHNLRGGIDLWAERIDPRMPRY